jgi:aspartate aminotransferase-like enzyme
MRPFGRCFLPGPTDVHPEVWDATLEPMYFTFSERMQSLMAELQPGLQQLFGTTQTVLTSTCSATGLMEAAIRGGVRQRVLVASGGYFGEMFARVAEACGKEAIRATVPAGQALEPEHLAQLLEGSAVDAVAVVHSESSTGALAPLPDLARVVRSRPGILLLVDGVTSVGAMPVEADAWELDFVLTGSQKALALPPGLALGVASPRFMERAESLGGRGWYLSVTHLAGAAKKNLPLSTPALPLYHALRRQLKRIEAEGGLPARYARHRAMADRMAQWADGQPALRLLAPEGRRSPAVSAFTAPPGRKPSDIVGSMERRGWLITTGLPPMTEQLIRIGHMGDLGLAHLDQLLAELDQVLAS